HGDSTRTMRLNNLFALFVQLRDERYEHCYSSNDVFLFELPCPRPLCDVIRLCRSVCSMLLMLSGDVESNPGTDMAQLMEKLQIITRDVKDIKQGKAVTDSLIAETNERLTTIEQRVDSLTKLTATVTAFQDKVLSLERNVDFLMAKIDDLENQSRRNHLIVYGIHETTDEDSIFLENLVKKDVFESILKVQTAGTERIHLLGRKSPNKTRPIILKLLDGRDKTKILTSSRLLKGSAYSILEDFSPRVQQIRKKLWESAKDLRTNGDKVIFRQVKTKWQGFSLG
ncbi:uncharacterized protein LOC115320747, partial [Ixodes scapularis]|uniref:uncharacterized protein LOC115320747 n=1 Tax=Ixodes scapularis TaxID=6945 RepID=UPI001C38EAC9